VHFGGSGFTHGPAEFIGEAFISPSETTVDSEGNFYAVGERSVNIFRIGRDGSVTTIVGTSKQQTSLIDGPHQIRIDQDNTIYVASRDSANIAKIENSLSEIFSESYYGKAAALESITDTFNCFSEDAVLPVFRFYNYITK